ncbi:spore maturation protein [Halobacillus litoralis]|uniref:Spore maturation protein n=1 Tax=Halobacillus litoralis TaxID=45668 RepID=A0A845FAD4_9BACI|nr:MULTISPECIES: spore maturation protein [Halobacillus]MBN9653126.1 spore maturation protein [Halobacillus sp. GSS1]MEC3884714.1 spore maturation protein [Halobacillus sp. HZG1]MYL71253.1 spore maturation protein [Halobacillus litoralis]
MISIWLIPSIILLVLVTATLKKVPSYEVFVEGSKEGIQIAISLLPFLLGMMVSIAVFQASGAMGAIVKLFEPLMSLFGAPAEILPLAFIRPISGTAALSMTTELIRTFGPDSFIGQLASVMQGSTDTTLYIITVYFGAVGIKRMGDALKVGLLADLVGIIASIIIVIILFS